MAKYLDSSGITTLWNKAKGTFLSQGGGVLSGTLTVKSPIVGYNYNKAGGNAAAFIFDKPGSNLTGIGAHTTSSTIWFGACDGSGNWIDDFKQVWDFNGTIKQQGVAVSLSGHTHNYLPLSGGTISNTSGINLVLNNTTSSQVGISLRNEGTQKAIVGWEPGTYGVYLQNTSVSGAPYVNLASDGVFKYCNSQTFWHSGNDGSGSGLDADKLDGYEYTAFVPKKHDNYFYPYINTEHSSCWYRVTLPFTGHWSTGNSWLMVKMEISLGGTYSSGAGGRIFLSYYFYKTAGEEGPWAAHNVYGIAIGWKLSSNSVKIMYDLSDPAIFYLYAGDSSYNTISIDNLSANDTAAAYDFSTTTISRIAASSIPETVDKTVPISFVETTNGTNLLINNHAVWTDGNFTPGNYLPLTGGTLSGALRFSQNVGGHVSVDASGIYMETGQHWIRVSNSGGADYDGSTIYHSGNFTPGNYVTKANPGTLTSTGNAAITLNGLDNTSETGIVLNRKGTNKAWIGYHDSYGAYIYNSARGKYLNYKDDGTLQFEGNTVYHSGNLTLSTLGGAASGHTHSDYLYTTQVSEDQSNITWAQTYGASNPRSFTYNTSGTEWSYLFGLRSDIRYGAILKMGYNDTYLRILRVNNNTWQSNDWEKISAGYADSAGSIAWGNISGKPSEFTPASHDHDSTYLKLSGGNLSGPLKVTQYIFAYNYGHAGTNAPAIVFDKPGSNYTGIGCHNSSDTIWFGAANISNGEAAWVDSYKQIWDFNGTIKQQGTEVALSTHNHDSTYVKIRQAGYSYNNIAAAYCGGTNPVYWRVEIPKPDVWCMIQLSFSLIEDYNSGRNAKIIVYGTCYGSLNWYGFVANVWGHTDHSNIRVYGSDKKYIYIYTNNAWETLSLDKMICSDGITGYDISAVTIDWVSQLPETYQTATMEYGLHTGNKLANSEIDTIMV